MNFYFGGTSLLIVVGVAMDTVTQIEAQLIMRHYDGFTPTQWPHHGRRRTLVDWRPASGAVRKIFSEARESRSLRRKEIRREVAISNGQRNRAQRSDP